MTTVYFLIVKYIRIPCYFCMKSKHFSHALLKIFAAIDFHVLWVQVMRLVRLIKVSPMLEGFCYKVGIHLIQIIYR